MELPNYGFELIRLSPLHAISMCQGGQDSQRAVPSPHPSTRQGVCTAPAMPECGPRCPVPRVWGQRCWQRQPGVAAPPQGPPLPAWGLAALAPTAGHPSPGTHELVPSRPHGTHRALFPASPGCLLSPTAPPDPVCPEDPCQAVPDLSAALHGERVPSRSQLGGGQGDPPAQHATGMVWGGQDRPSPTCRGCRWGPEPGELSGFSGSPLTDSEEQTRPPSPGPAGRSVKVTLSPASLLEQGGETAGGPGRPLRPLNGPRCQGPAPWPLSVPPTGGTRW